MSLIILPRPNTVVEGPGRWTPDMHLKSAMDGVTMQSDLSHIVTFRKGKLPPEGYSLNAGAGGVIIGHSDEPGRWNALMTLKQILRQTDAGAYLPELTIRDFPAFSVRGMMLDISRGRVPSMQTAKALVDLWAELKVNQIQLYTEHTFAYAGHEKIWRNASPFTPEEIDALDTYCINRCVELVPNQNSFGHMERWLRHPEYHRYAESPQGFTDSWGVFRDVASTLDLEKPETVALLADLYDQLLPHFTSRNFNIGGDETYDLGKGSNATLCEREGIGRVYLRHLRRITAEVEKREHVPHFYADIILNYPELLNEVPSEAVVLNWGYEPHHPFEAETRILAESGHAFQVCPGTASWNALAGRWTAASTNIRSAAKWGRVNGATGLLTTDWGDNGHKQQYVAALPGWFAGAAAAWSGTLEDDDIAAALQIHVFGNVAGREAEWLLKMADLYRESPVSLHNMSFLTLPLIDHGYHYYRPFYDDIRRGGMGDAREIAGEAALALPGGDGGGWGRQLAFTAEITALAADLAEPFYASEDYRVDHLPVALRKALARRLDKTMISFADLWGEYCRPGGLDESLVDFAEVLKRLRA